HAWAMDPAPILIEEFVAGTPVTVGLLELPSGLLTFPPLACGGETGPVSPADLPPAVLDTLAFHARSLWQGLGCHGTARVDFVVTDAGQPFALEVNTTPELSHGGTLVLGARRCGLETTDILRAILYETLTRPACEMPLPERLLDSFAERVSTRTVVATGRGAR
ncbi:hypothetical protein ACW9HQ_49205, partial [Nocardia gipuzkoensis]